jgi:cysteine desulfurase
MNPIYLDHNATTAPAPEVVREMLDTLERAWANPSSSHEPGQAAKRALADARVRVAHFLGCLPAEIVFTSGATEANHMAVLGALAATRGSGRKRIVMSAVEHPGLLALGTRLRDEGMTVDLIPVDVQGRLDLARAAQLIGPDVAVVSVMGANNETGVLMPVAELAALCQAAGCWLHVDATQRAGKSLLDFARSGAHLMSVSAHKLHGPKGVGALVVKKGVVVQSLLAGRQERQRRGGTENLPGIVGFAAACERTAATLVADMIRMELLRDELEAGLAALPGVYVYGRDVPRLPNTVCVRFGDLASDPVLTRLERAGVVASSGAACTAGGTQPSHVLLAMGESAEHAKGGIRFSLGRDSTAADIQHTLQAVQRVLLPLMAEQEQPLTA